MQEEGALLGAGLTVGPGLTVGVDVGSALMVGAGEMVGKVITMSDGTDVGITSYGQHAS